MVHQKQIAKEEQWREIPDPHKEVVLYSSLTRHSGERGGGKEGKEREGGRKGGREGA